MGREHGTDIDTGKKIKRTTRQANGAQFMLRCATLGLHTDELDDMTVGMVLDMLTEQANDREEYPEVADQEAIHRFFG